MELPEPPDQEQADRRLARRRLARLEDYEAAVRHAEHLRATGAPELSSLRPVLEEIDSRRHSLTMQAGGHLERRHRPKQTWSRWNGTRPGARVFIDETGLTKGTDPNFPTFATAAVIVREEAYAELSENIYGWQDRWFGRQRYIHESDIRRGTGAFHMAGNTPRREAALAEYYQLLNTLPYTLITVVIEKDQFHHIHPDGNVDGYLPGRLYPLAIQMLFERVVHYLYHDSDRRGIIEAEGIGEKEDALLQQSFADLKLHGTRFLQEAWFRYQLGDYVAFHGKAENKPGLQLADWVVKPAADAVVCARRALAGRPTTHHPGWANVREHLYDGNQNRPDTFGLKVYPSTPPEMREFLFPGRLQDVQPDWAPRKPKGPDTEAWDPW